MPLFNYTIDTILLYCVFFFFDLIYLIISVSGRRVRCTKNDDDVVSASPKRKDSRMENMGSLANGVIAADKVKDGVSNIPLTRSKNGLKSNKKGGHIKKNGFITNYFTVVTPEKNFHLSCDPLICQSETSSITSELSIVEEKTEHFALNCYTGYESFTDIIHSSCDNGKNDIINNLFKKGAESDECDSVVKIEETHEDEVTIINDAVKGENPFDVSNLRFSPRKHASTLQRCGMKSNGHSKILKSSNK